MLCYSVVHATVRNYNAPISSFHSYLRCMVDPLFLLSICTPLFFSSPPFSPLLSSCSLSVISSDRPCHPFLFSFLPLLYIAPVPFSLLVLLLFIPRYSPPLLLLLAVPSPFRHFQKRNEGRPQSHEAHHQSLLCSGSIRPGQREYHRGLSRRRYR